MLLHLAPNPVRSDKPTEVDLLPQFRVDQEIQPLLGANQERVVVAQAKDRADSSYP